MSAFRCLAAVAVLLLSLPLHAGFTVTGAAAGGEDALISGSIVENFEDTTLIPELSIEFSGGITPVTYPGTMPRIWDPTTASGAGGLGGPFTMRTWDGAHALTNGGHGGPGVTGISPGDGNFWDFDFAALTTFVFDTPKQAVGVGLSNFQSLGGGPFPITDHEILVNGTVIGTVEALAPSWTPGINVQNGYVVITADGGDSITSIGFRNIQSQDGLVFDKLAVKAIEVPLTSTWTIVALAMGLLLLLTVARLRI